MRRLLLLSLLLVGIGMLTAVSVSSIRAEDYSGVVCRLVFQMDQDTDFVIQKQSDGFFLGLNQVSGELPPYSLGGTFIDGISIVTGGIKIRSSLDLSHHSMRLSDHNAIVIDLFKQATSKRDRLITAKFLADKGRLASADREFNSLAIDYPDHYDILYHWGELLIKRESSRAPEKLAMIPRTSHYYEAAQELIRDNSMSQQTDPAQNVEEESEDEEPMVLMQMPGLDEVAEDSVYGIATITRVEDHYDNGQSLLSKVADWGNRHFVITIIIFVVLLVVLCIMIFGNYKMSKKLKKESIEESSQPLDTETMCKIVNRLLTDGWTNKEIAKELKISNHDVELIVRRLHYMSINEDDVKP